MTRRRTVVSHVPADAFEPDVCRALQALGYEIVRAGEEPKAAELWIVDDADLERIARGPGPPVPVVALTRDSAPPPADPCVIDAIRRPAPFQSLYVALQTALEANPRRFPRVPMARTAWCLYGGRICVGAVVSLSAGGCLFRSDEDLPWVEPKRHSTGDAAIVLFRLDLRRLLKVRARMAHQTGSDLGLGFLDLDPDACSAISEYVMAELLAN